jgi:hypothetical protein
MTANSYGPNSARYKMPEFDPTIAAREYRADPERLWNDCVEYFLWCEQNPLTVEKSAFQASSGEWVTHHERRPRVFTIKGLCMWLGIDHSTWQRWRIRRPEMRFLVEHVESIIWSNKFEYATIGVYNPHIISRDLGLADRQELTGADGGPLQTEDVTKRDAADFLSQLSRLAAAAGAREPSIQPEPDDEGDA